jgi:hypothetical protein
MAPESRQPFGSCSGYSALIAEMFICLGDPWLENVSPYFAELAP